MTIATRGRTGEPLEEPPNETDSVVPVSPPCTPETFPVGKLQILDEKISNPRWVVPVLPDQELECLLKAAIDLCKAGSDTDSEHCQRFFREGLTISFTKILTDEAVNGWKYNIHHCILQSCVKVLELCIIKMPHDWFPLLDLLAMVLNPNNKFHTFNASRASDTIPNHLRAGSNIPSSYIGTTSVAVCSDDSLANGIFAKPSGDPRTPRGWLVDLINKFGQMGGFDALLERFHRGAALLQQPSSQVTSLMSQSSDQITIPSCEPLAIPTSDYSSSLSTIETTDGNKEAHTTPVDNNQLTNIPEAIAPVTTQLQSPVDMQQSITAPATSMNTSSLLSENLMSSINSNSPLLNNISLDNARLSLPVVHALLKPFGQCHELLTVNTITKYLMPILELVPSILESLSDDELKREAKPESKNDSVGGIVRAARNLARRLNKQDGLVKELEMFRLKMILRLLQISSFNGKMNALNEINKVLSVVTSYPHRAHSSEDDLDWLTSDIMASWIKDNNVLDIVLRDSLHQPQYVEKLEKILRFLIKEHSLTLSDLDAVWSAQVGKHEAIVKNVHDLLAKLAWDFSAEQLDHLFECFQASWTTANKKQRERLLELIRRLAEDDKDGVMAHKVLMLFWTLAHSDEVSPEVLDQALSAHVKILDYSCSQERDAQKTVWLDKCVDELKSGDQWTLPALKLIREICCLYEPSTNITNHTSRQHQMLHRQEVIDRLQNQHSLVILVTNSLTGYMENVRALVKEDPNLDPNALITDGRYPHPQQLQERLNFLRFLLKDGQLWLCADQAKQIWQCLAEGAVFPSDREACFRWFGKLMGEEPDLDPGINRDFFENNLLRLDPTYLSESGIKCFERFFKAVNLKEGKLKAKRRGFVLDDVELIGSDYLWRVITCSGEDIANRAIELLKEVTTSLGPRLQDSQAGYHKTFIGECCERLKTHYDTVSLLTTLMDKSDKVDSDRASIMAKLNKEADRMCRVLKVIQEYVIQCDQAFVFERRILPLHRACRGKHMTLLVRFQNPGRPVDDVEVYTHSNDTLSSLRRQVLRRIKASSSTVKLELFMNGDPLDATDDRQTISQTPIRDKMVLTGKLSQVGAGLASSPDSSSDSSTGSPPRPGPDQPRPDLEVNLPGVIISRGTQYAVFFLQLSQLGVVLCHGRLRDSARRLLHLVPPDLVTVYKLQAMCGLEVSMQEITEPPTFENLFFKQGPAQVLYHLEVLQAVLFPSLDPLSDLSYEVQQAWVRSGVAHQLIELFTKNNFMATVDTHMKRAAYLCILRLTKFFLSIVGCVLSRVGDEPAHVHADGNLTSPRSHIAVLKQAIHSVFNQQAEQILRSVATKIAQTLSEKMLMADSDGEHYRLLFGSALQWQLPDLNTIRTMVRMAWAASTGSLHLHCTGQDLGKENALPDAQDVKVCKEAMEVLTISMVLNPSAHEVLVREAFWSNFITNLVLVSESQQVRVTASEQLLLMSTWCATDRQPLEFMTNLLISVLDSQAPRYAHQSQEYFVFLCRLLNYAYNSNWPVNVATQLLTKEISWLKLVRENVTKYGDSQVHESLLEGHLCLAKELLSFLSPEDKSELGCGESSSVFLIKELVEDFLFPASKLHLELVRGGQIDSGGEWGTVPSPVCQSPQTIAAACDLLVALCTGSSRNLRELVNMMTNMFYSDTEPLREWEYMPPVGPRPGRGFCGLKNAGATCYMNSVLQQLYMVHTIRSGLLSSMGAATDNSEDFSGEEHDEMALTQDNSERTNYHVGILKHVQAIFAHLAHSHLQFYVPRGLWSHFKLQGEPVNLREQQDAVEFFMSLVESLDEGLKGLGHPQLMGATLGGSYSDQKICRGCPHRYSKEEPFSVISVDIRNHSSLADSLEQYVKGELLEGADAYHCDKCDKKVVTVKRLCVRKLPPVLAIQLKRFEYDFERVCAIKFNDYFEFPRELDMEPYTVSGLARMEGEVIDVECEDVQNPNLSTTNNSASEIDAINTNTDKCDNNNANNADNEDQTSNTNSATETKYQLSGIVVHSGQASGGHYYSYILHRENGLWYKFDDGDVTECKMDEDEEMKVQCFGGDYMGEIFDHMLKRMQYRRQKRWWNAYMLFYTRSDQPIPPIEKCVEQLSLAESGSGILKMPPAIERSVRIQNIKFLHSRNMYSVEYFTFIRKLVACNTPREKLSPSMEELSLLSIQLATRFLFHSGIKTKKSLRGSACEWYDAISPHLRYSGMVRAWFAWHGLLESRTRIAEYLLAAPSAEVRGALMKIIVFLAHFSKEDSPLTTGGLKSLEGSTLSEQLLIAVLSLLHTDISEHGKHLPHFFTLFHMYSSLGVAERAQLLQLNVPALFMQVAIDEGPGPTIKYMYPEFTKLHQVVSLLVRCCDVSSRTHSANAAQGVATLANPYADISEPLCPLEPAATEILFTRNSYLKKLIEDSTLGEDGLRLLQFCSWENPHFSRAVLTELLWQVAYAYCHELRHNTDLLLGLLLIEDSWQSHRIHNAIMGVQEEREGLLDTIQRSKTHYQKRAYHCIKCLVNLFTRSRVAAALLHNNVDLSRRWVSAVEWLHDELERRYPTYNTWSPPAHSNDSMSGYFLERSPSARNILQKAFELCPTEEPEEGSEQEVEQTDEQLTATSVSSVPTTATDANVNKTPTGSQSMPTLSPTKESIKPDVVVSTESVPGPSYHSTGTKSGQSVTFSQVLQQIPTTTPPLTCVESTASVDTSATPPNTFNVIEISKSSKENEDQPSTSHSLSLKVNEDQTTPVVQSSNISEEKSEIVVAAPPSCVNKPGVTEGIALISNCVNKLSISDQDSLNNETKSEDQIPIEQFKASTIVEISQEESKT